MPRSVFAELDQERASLAPRESDAVRVRRDGRRPDVSYGNQQRSASPTGSSPKEQAQGPQPLPCHFRPDPE
jgi:hypothetical protein